MATNTQNETKSVLDMTVRDIVLPIFDQSWVTDNDNRESMVGNFRTLVESVNKIRQTFDDLLKTEHAKGKLLKVEHIRKPRTVEAKEQTLDSFLSSK